MEEDKIKCPNCEKLMGHITESDITFEKCPQCGGIFLDKGELNTLATSMAGDMEFCSIESDQGDPDQFPTMMCPKCPGQQMKKEDLLIYSDLIFDYCEKCGGWFLDYGKLDKMNNWLGKLRESQGGSDEYRGKHRDHLVTLTRREDFSVVYRMGILPSGRTIEWSRIEVFYRKPFQSGLRLSSETWVMKIWKLTGTQDIKTGDPEFDSLFLIQGNSEKDILSILSRKARKAILDFYKSPLFKVGPERTFEVLDNRIAYTYLGKITQEQREKLIESLVDMVVGME